MNTDILKMEKRAIFEASLKLVSVGKFQGTPLNEIAFLAKMSANLIHCIFETREKLLAELSQMVLAEIGRLIEETREKTTDFKQRFFAAWIALYKHYTRNPDVVSFLEQFDNLNGSPHYGELEHPARSHQLIKMFTDAGFVPGEAEALAAVFHSNILSAAKMKTGTALKGLSFDPDRLSKMLWDGLQCSVKEASNLAL